MPLDSPSIHSEETGCKAGALVAGGARVVMYEVMTVLHDGAVDVIVGL